MLDISVENYENGDRHINKVRNRELFWVIMIDIQKVLV